MVVSEDVYASDVVEGVKKAGGELLRSVSVFDVYRGDQIGAGMKSLALSFRFRAPDRTLSDEEVDPLMAAIIDSLGAVGGTIRSGNE